MIDIISGVSQHIPSGHLGKFKDNLRESLFNSV